MAITPLAYIATSGSGTGYAAWTSGSNVIVPVVNWTSSAGPAGTKWWMSPNYDENTGPFLIAKVEPTESVPTAPATWLYNGTNTVPGPGEILALASGTPTPGFRNSTNQIVIDNQNYELGLNGIGGNLPVSGVANNWVNGSQITLVSPGQAGTVVYSILGVTSTSGYTTLSVSHVSGGLNTLSLNETVAIITSTGVSTTAANRTRGTIHFWRLNTANNLNITNLAKAAGLPGSYNDGVGVRTAALATSNYWVSWVNWPL